MFQVRRVSSLMAIGLCCSAMQLPGPASAATLQVPADHPTIQGAIVAAIDGDLVLVAAGTYAEELDFLGKAIVVRSVAGPASTIVDPSALHPAAVGAARRFERRFSSDGRVAVVETAGGLPVAGTHQGTVVLFVSGEPREAVLEGFTITGGFAEGGGGGVRIEKGSAPTLRNNVIAGNQACHYGGGISVLSSSPLIDDNVISGNKERSNCSGGSGGGIYLGAGASAVVRRNLIAGNTYSYGGGLALSDAGTPIIANNHIVGNIGHGFDIVNFSDALIVQNVIRDNSGDGVHWEIPLGGRGPFLVNNSIVHNDGYGLYTDGFDVTTQVIGNVIVAPDGGEAVYCGFFDSQSERPILRANNVLAPNGFAYSFACGSPTGADGNISADPLFADVDAGDLRLLAGSPSIDAGDGTHPNLEPADLDGFLRIVDGDGDGQAQIDQGAYERQGHLLVFANGFESADTAGWTTTLP